MVTNNVALVGVPPGPMLDETPDPLNVAAVAPIRLVPVTAIMNVVPGKPIVGVIPLIVGIAGTTVKGNPLEIPPPGGRFVTLMLSVCPADNTVAGITAVSELELTNELVRLPNAPETVPVTFTVDEGMNPLPVIFNVTSPEPTLADTGLI